MISLKYLLFLLLSLKANSQNSCPELYSGCITFKIGQGTGCDWMCNYCAEKLGTNNYYFIDGICKYKLAGCQGNPFTGINYTCCTAPSKEGKNITIYLNNSKNSLLSNPPGFNLLVGGNYYGDPEGLNVLKTDTYLSYTIPATTQFILTWYYDWGWYSGLALQGPWEDKELIELPQVSKRFMYYILY